MLFEFNGQFSITQSVFHHCFLSLLSLCRTIGSDDDIRDGQVNVGDAVYLIADVFIGGAEPCCP
jgi:hypothetical protein